MRRLNLDSFLLLTLVSPIIMTYRLSPGLTPYWLFGIVFLLLLGYLIIPVKQMKLKDVCLWLIIILVVGSVYGSAIVVRHQTAPIYQIHDMPLQLEAAIQFFLQGENPYTVNYFGTPLEDWRFSDIQVNPALYHFVTMPWYLLFSLPFYFVSIPVLGYFDGRMPLLFSYGLILFLTWKLLKEHNEKRLALVLLAFNPAAWGYFLEGRSDLFMFSFLFFGLFLLEKKKFFWAGIPLALAFATKQSAWPVFPFYLFFIWWQTGKNWLKIVKYLIPFTLTFSLVVLPFLFWDVNSFLDDTLFYLSGSTEHSYPISGYGWGMVLNQLGLIKNLSVNYPFWIWQLVICLPIMVGLLYWLAKSVTVSRLLTAYGIFTLVFWYFSRYFNNSHLAYLSVVFIATYFWPVKKRND